MTQHATDQAAVSPAGTMTAAVVTEPGRIQLQDVAIPTPGPELVRLRVEGCGVCASNIPPFEGREWFKYPLERLGEAIQLTRDRPDGFMKALIMM